MKINENKQTIKNTQPNTAQHNIKAVGQTVWPQIRCCRSWLLIRAHSVCIKQWNTVKRRERQKHATEKGYDPTAE